MSSLPSFRSGPITRTLALLLGYALLVVTAALAVRTLAPGWSLLDQSLAVTVLLAGLTTVIARSGGGLRSAGVVGPGHWRDRRLLLVPAGLAFVPLLAGIRPVETSTLVVLLVGYALTGYFEELLWRGIVLRTLAPVGPLMSAVVGSLLFGAAHLTNVLFRGSVALVVAQAIGAACFGLGYAALRMRTHALVALMACHFATDLFAELGAFPKIPILVAQDVVLLALGWYLLRRVPRSRSATAADVAQAVPQR